MSYDEVAQRFAGYLRNSELPDDLFAPDVFCDLNVPQWRFQLQGAEELARWGKSESPRGSEVRLGRVSGTGDAITVETEIITGRVYSRSIWLLHLDPAGLIDEVVFYCTGPWDQATIERQAREAPMIRA